MAQNCAAQRKEWGSISAGYNYLYLDAGNGSHPSLHGWYAIPVFNIGDNWGVLADFTSFYRPGENIHGFTFGPIYSFKNHTRVTPVVFAEIGDIRDSKGGVITNAFAFVVGGGFLTKIWKNVSFQLIPGEYVLNTPNGNAAHNYTAKAGFTVSIPARTR